MTRPKDIVKRISREARRQGVDFEFLRHGAMARGLIGFLTDVDRDSFELSIDVRMPDGVDEHLQRAAELRATEAQARTQAAAEVRAAASELRGAGISIRDIGALLGVSFQRAHQLTQGRP